MACQMLTSVFLGHPVRVHRKRKRQGTENPLNLKRTKETCRLKNKGGLDCNVSLVVGPSI